MVFLDHNRGERMFTMNISKIITGVASENCYFVQKNDQLLIIDPGAEPERILDKIDSLAAEPIAILLTHAHFDHIGALDAIRQVYDIPTYLSIIEKDWPMSTELNGSQFFHFDITAAQPDQLIPEETEQLTIGEFQIDIRRTPGHSPGSLSYIFTDDKVVISGDALFRESIGRTDLHGGDQATLLTSIRQQLLTLPDDYHIYPGHGMSTTIAHEKEHNIFFMA